MIVNRCFSRLSPVMETRPQC